MSVSIVGVLCKPIPHYNRDLWGSKPVTRMVVMTNSLVHECVHGEWCLRTGAVSKPWHHLERDLYAVQCVHSVSSVLRTQTHMQLHNQSTIFIFLNTFFDSEFSHSISVSISLHTPATHLGVDILVFVRGGGQPPVPAQHVSVEGRS